MQDSNKQEISEVHMEAENSSTHPLYFVQNFRQNYTNLYKLWTQMGSVPEGVTLRTPKEKPIQEKELSESLRTRLLAYKKTYPEGKIELVKFMRLVNGNPVLVIEDERGLPEEDHILILSQTVALNTSDTAELVTEILVGWRG